MVRRQIRKPEKQGPGKNALRLAILAVLFGILVLLFFPGRGLFHYRSLKKKANSLTMENDRLQKENEQLVQEIERLKTDEAYIEQLAREKHGLLKKNEEVYDFDRSKK